METQVKHKAVAKVEGFVYRSYEKKSKGICYGVDIKVEPVLSMEHGTAFYEYSK